MNIFLERVHGYGALLTLGEQLCWVVALLIAGRILLRAAVRKLVVQGG